MIVTVTSIAKHKIELYNCNGSLRTKSDKITEDNTINF